MNPPRCSLRAPATACIAQKRGARPHRQGERPMTASIRRPGSAFQRHLFGCRPLAAVLPLWVLPVLQPRSRWTGIDQHGLKRSNARIAASMPRAWYARDPRGTPTGTASWRLRVANVRRHVHRAGGGVRVARAPAFRGGRGGPRGRTPVPAERGGGRGVIVCLLILVVLSALGIALSF